VVDGLKTKVGSTEKDVVVGKTKQYIMVQSSSKNGTDNNTYVHICDTTVGTFLSSNLSDDTVLSSHEISSFYPSILEKYEWYDGKIIFDNIDGIRKIFIADAHDNEIYFYILSGQEYTSNNVVYEYKIDISSLTSDITVNKENLTDVLYNELLDLKKNVKLQEMYIIYNIDERVTIRKDNEPNFQCKTDVNVTDLSLDFYKNGDYMNGLYSYD
jgi:hypothetical protein